VAKTTARRRAVRYLVVRQSFGRYGGYCNESQAGGNNGARVPLKLFPTRAAAEAYREELEAKARRAVNPFRFSPLEDVFGYNEFSEGGDPDDIPEDVRANLVPAVPLDRRAREWKTGLRALGLTPPDLTGWEGRDAAADWWDETAPGLTDEQLAAAWKVFDGFRLFEVVEIETG